MSDPRIGCADLPDRTSLERYFAASADGGIDLLETTLCLRGVPSDKVLRRWRAAAPARAYAVVAPAALATATPPVAALVEGFAAAVAALDAAAVVFRTGPELSPGTAGRDALRRLFGETAAAERFPGRDRIWHPGALWELEASARFAREIGVVCAVDPLAEDPGVDLGPALIAHLEVGVGYLRPSGVGHKRARLAQDDVEGLVALIAPLHRAYCVFANLDALASARGFKRAWLELAADGGDDGEPESEDDDDEESD